MTHYKRKQIENMHLRQLEHVGRQMEARDIKSKHMLTRMQWLQRQTNTNYRNELDRIRGEMSRSTVPNQMRERLERREKDLESLFSHGNL